MRRFTLFLLLLVAVSVDCSVLTKISIGGLNLSVTLCVIVSIAVVYGKQSGAFAGLAAGLIMDLLFAPAFGFYAATNMITGYTAGVLFSKGMREDPLLIGLLTIGMYMLREGIAAALSLLLGVDIGNLLLLIVRYLLPSALLCGVACAPLYVLLHAFMTTGYMRKKHAGFE